MIKKNDTNKDQPVIRQVTLGKEISIGIGKFIFFLSLVILLALSPYFYLKFFSFPAISESHQNNTTAVPREPFYKIW